MPRRMRVRVDRLVPSAGRTFAERPALTAHMATYGQLEPIRVTANAQAIGEYAVVDGHARVAALHAMPANRHGLRMASVEIMDAVEATRPGALARDLLRVQNAVADARLLHAWAQDRGIEEVVRCMAMPRAAVERAITLATHPWVPLVEYGAMSLGALRYIIRQQQDESRTMPQAGFRDIAQHMLAACLGTGDRTAWMAHGARITLFAVRSAYEQQARMERAAQGDHAPDTVTDPAGVTRPVQFHRMVMGLPDDAALTLHYVPEAPATATWTAPADAANADAGESIGGRTALTSGGRTALTSAHVRFIDHAARVETRRLDDVMADVLDMDDVRAGRAVPTFPGLHRLELILSPDGTNHMHRARLTALHSGGRPSAPFSIQQVDVMVDRGAGTRPYLFTGAGAARVLAAVSHTGRTPDTDADLLRTTAAALTPDSNNTSVQQARRDVGMPHHATDVIVPQARYRELVNRAEEALQPYDPRVQQMCRDHGVCLITVEMLERLEDQARAHRARTERAPEVADDVIPVVAVPDGAPWTPPATRAAWWPQVQAVLETIMHSTPMEPQDEHDMFSACIGGALGAARAITPSPVVPPPTTPPPTPPTMPDRAPDVGTPAPRHRGRGTAAPVRDRTHVPRPRRTNRGALTPDVTAPEPGEEATTPPPPVNTRAPRDPVIVPMTDVERVARTARLRSNERVTGPDGLVRDGNGVLVGMPMTVAPEPRTPEAARRVAMDALRTRIQERTVALRPAQIDAVADAMRAVEMGAAAPPRDLPVASDPVPFTVRQMQRRMEERFTQFPMIVSGCRAIVIVDAFPDRLQVEATVRDRQTGRVHAAQYTITVERIEAIPSGRWDILDATVRETLRDDLNNLWGQADNPDADGVMRITSG